MPTATSKAYSFNSLFGASDHLLRTGSIIEERLVGRRLGSRLLGDSSAGGRSGQVSLAAWEVERRDSDCDELPQKRLPMRLLIVGLLCTLVLQGCASSDGRKPAGSGTQASSPPWDRGDMSGDNHDHDHNHGGNGRM